MRGLVLLAALVAGCGSGAPAATQSLATAAPTPASTPAPAPTVTIPPISAPPATAAPVADFAALAASACADATYRRCIESVISMAELVPGSLVAICDYSDGTGDVVIVESEAEAEAQCSGDGLISPSRVVGVIQLPGE